MKEVPLWAWTATTIITLLGVVLLMCLVALDRDDAQAQSRSTVTVPGPTITVSYLLIRTATPGRNGF